MSWGQDFLNEHVGFLTKQDFEGLMEHHYHDDAELVTFEFVKKGKAAIKQYLSKDQPAKSGKILGMTMDAYFESDDVILFTASVKSELLGTFVARDALYVKDGKVLRHIALTLPPAADKKIYQAM
ncbi:MAG: hypothetical protein WC378_01150 [Opitutaceae bacterium]|jgi:hypothetical protein